MMQTLPSSRLISRKPIGSRRRSTKYVFRFALWICSYPRRAHEEEDIEVKVENQLQKAKSATKKAKVLTPVQLFDRAVQVCLARILYLLYVNSCSRLSGGSIVVVIRIFTGQPSSIME